MAASSTAPDDVLYTFKSVTGALGRLPPSCAQQFVKPLPVTAHAATLVVWYTPKSPPTYTDLLSFGSTTTLFTGAVGSVLERLFQVWPPSAEP